MAKLPEYRLTLKRERLLEVGEALSNYNAAEKAINAWFTQHEPAFESVILLGLNGQNRLLGVVEISRGGAHGCALSPRDVLVPALVMGAAAFILAHNHPSGDPTPSAEDLVMTQAVSQAGEMVGLPLLDHLVWTPDRTESCRLD